jgi:hypothetical protein
MTMARMSIDDMVGRDHRVILFAQLMGGPPEWSTRAALGFLVGELWPACYDRMTPVLSERLIETVGGRGTVDALVAAELATRTDDGIRIAGASERIEYLTRARSYGSEGGKKSAKTRTSNGPSRVPTSDPPGGPEATLKLSPDSAPPPERAMSTPPERKKKTARDGRAHLEHPGYQSTVEFWFVRFQAKHGAKPTWGAREGKALNELLAVHQPPEVTRRMAILFENPPDWPRQPWTFLQFRAHFDSLVTPAAPRAHGFQREPRGAEAARIVRLQADEEAERIRNMRPPWDEP